jgi:hypothetical protein
MTTTTKLGEVTLTQGDTIRACLAGDDRERDFEVLAAGTCDAYDDGVNARAVVARGRDRLIAVVFSARYSAWCVPEHCRDWEIDYPGAEIQALLDAGDYGIHVAPEGERR